MELKRVAAIHDISGFGKCSLTVALPIISAAGIETSVIPDGWCHLRIQEDLRGSHTVT